MPLCLGKRRCGPFELLKVDRIAQHLLERLDVLGALARRPFIYGNTLLELVRKHLRLAEKTCEGRSRLLVAGKGSDTLLVGGGIRILHAFDLAAVEKELNAIKVVLRDLIGHRARDAALADTHIDDIAHQPGQRELAVRLREQQHERDEEVDAVSLHESEDLHRAPLSDTDTRHDYFPRQPS